MQMANKRMFSARVTESARFLKMPPSSQSLYFHLGMKADDDGVVEAYPVMRMTSSTEDDLRVLVGKGFITVLNEDLVVFINDWMENNNIRADRKTDSFYKDLLLQVVPEAKIKDTKPSYYSRKKEICQTNDCQMSDTCQANVSIGKVRIDKNSLSKDSIDNNIICPEPEPTPDLSDIQLPLVDKSYYDVPLEKIEKWKVAYPAVDVKQELRKMISWLDANPKRKKHETVLTALLILGFQGNRTKEESTRMVQGSRHVSRQPMKVTKCIARCTVISNHHRRIRFSKEVRRWKKKVAPVQLYIMVNTLHGIGLQSQAV